MILKQLQLLFLHLYTYVLLLEGVAPFYNCVTNDDITKLSLELLKIRLKPFNTPSRQAGAV